MATHQLPVQLLLLIHNFSWDRKHYWLDLIKSQEIPTDFKKKRHPRTEDYTNILCDRCCTWDLVPYLLFLLTKFILHVKEANPHLIAQVVIFLIAIFLFSYCRILTQEYFIQWMRSCFSLCKKGSQGLLWDASQKGVL